MQFVPVHVNGEGPIVIYVSIFIEGTLSSIAMYVTRRAYNVVYIIAFLSLGPLCCLSELGSYVIGPYLSVCYECDSTR